MQTNKLSYDEFSALLKLINSYDRKSGAVFDELVGVCKVLKVIPTRLIEPHKLNEAILDKCEEFSRSATDSKGRVTVSHRSVAELIDMLSVLREAEPNGAVG